MGFALLTGRLYEIDIIINRTLVYGPLTAVLVLVYFGGVVSKLNCSPPGRWTC